MGFPVLNVEADPPAFEGNPETPDGPIENRLGKESTLTGNATLHRHVVEPTHNNLGVQAGGAGEWNSVPEVERFEELDRAVSLRTVRGTRKSPSPAKLVRMNRGEPRSKRALMRTQIGRAAPGTVACLSPCVRIERASPVGSGPNNTPRGGRPDPGRPWRRRERRILKRAPKKGRPLRTSRFNEPPSAKDIGHSEAS